MSKNWEQAYLDGATPWDKGEASPPLQEYLNRHTVTGRVLVPGCGLGHDVRLLSRLGAEVIGVDLSPTAVHLASMLPKQGNESYAVADIFDLSEAYSGQFDWVVEHTCLCAISPERRKDYADFVQMVLKPGGNFLAIFFREVADYDGDGPPHPIDAQEIDTLFGTGFKRIRSFVPTRHYSSRAYGAEEVCLFEKL